MYNLSFFRALANGMRTAGDYVRVGDKHYHVQRTSHLGLKKVFFRDNGKPLIAIEQNPAKSSAGAEAARAGKHVVQIKDSKGYVGMVVDGKVQLYGKRD